MRNRGPQPPPPLLLNLQELERFENLLVFAKATVEGYYAGKHKSPYRGSAAEFADYKEYVPGDDLARLDWRVYGRTRRLYLRQFEEETDMTVYLMVDTSGSMRYAAEKRASKFIVAAKIAAALAYLMMAQSDKAALVLFAQKVTQFLAPGGTRRHLHQIVTELERVRPARTTGIAEAVRECNALFKKRGRIVILSDFLDDTAALMTASSLGLWSGCATPGKERAAVTPTEERLRLLYPERDSQEPTVGEMRAMEREYHERDRKR